MLAGVVVCECAPISCEGQSAIVQNSDDTGPDI